MGEFKKVQVFHGQQIMARYEGDGYSQVGNLADIIDDAAFKAMKFGPRGVSKFTGPVVAIGRKR